MFYNVISIELMRTYVFLEFRKTCGCLLATAGAQLWSVYLPPLWEPALELMRELLPLVDYKVF